MKETMKTMRKKKNVCGKNKTTSVEKGKEVKEVYITNNKSIASEIDNLW